MDDGVFSVKIGDFLVGSGTLGRAAGVPLGLGVDENVETFSGASVDFKSRGDRTLGALFALMALIAKGGERGC